MMFPELRPENKPIYYVAGASLLAAAAVIVAALGFEYIGGYAPCPLCLMQRYAYYAGVPLLAVGLAGAAGWPRTAAFVFLVVALAFLANASLGVYHAGVEWKLWAGPDTCATAQTVPKSAADLLTQVESARVVRCDEAPWRMAGLSLAGWNAVMSIALCAGALRAAVLAAPRG